MKFAIGLTLAVLATLAPLQAAAPGQLAPERRADVSTDDKAILPGTKELKRNEVLMEKRVDLRTVERKESIVGERRSSIAVEEKREKKKFREPEKKEYSKVERKDSAWSGKRSRFSTSGDHTYNSKVAIRFQDKIGEATSFGDNVKPVVSKSTTFDRVNRFSFLRNSSRDVGATAAGSGQAPRDVSGSTNPGGSLPTLSEPKVNVSVTPGGAR